MGTRIEEFLETVVATAAGANEFLRREFGRAGVEHDADSLRIESTMTAAALLSRAICEAAMHIADAIRDARATRPADNHCAARVVVGGFTLRCELQAGHDCMHATRDALFSTTYPATTFNRCKSVSIDAYTDSDIASARCVLRSGHHVEGATQVKHSLCDGSTFNDGADS